jgi:hypothetical protein
MNIKTLKAALLGLVVTVSGASNAGIISYNYQGTLFQSEGDFEAFYGYSIRGVFSYDTDSFVSPDVYNNNEETDYYGLSNNPYNFISFNVVDINEQIVYEELVAIEWSTIWNNKQDESNPQSGLHSDMFTLFGAVGLDTGSGAAVGVEFGRQSTEEPLLINSLAPPLSLENQALWEDPHNTLTKGILRKIDDGGISGDTLFTIDSITPVNDVPEPSTLAIFALGIMGLASRRFKKH